MKGIETYSTRSGVRVLKLHYSADPDKDPDTEKGQLWLRRATAGFPGGMAGVKWRREMEIDFTIRGTSKVFPNFVDIQPKITCPRFEVPEHWPIWCGYDYGYREPFCFLALAWETKDRCYVVDEIYQSELSVYEQARAIKRRPYWNRIQGIIGDPSIWQQTQQDGVRVTTIGSLLSEQDVQVEKGRKEPGLDIAFRDFLKGHLWLDLDEPKLIIFDDCKNTLRELRNLSHKEHLTKGAQERQDLPETIVSKHTNAWDCLKVVLLERMPQEPEALPAVPGTYGWLIQKLRREQQRKAYILG